MDDHLFVLKDTAISPSTPFDLSPSLSSSLRASHIPAATQGTLVIFKQDFMRFPAQNRADLWKVAVATSPTPQLPAKFFSRFFASSSPIPSSVSTPSNLPSAMGMGVSAPSSALPISSLSSNSLSNTSSRFGSLWSWFEGGDGGGVGGGGEEPGAQGVESDDEGSGSEDDEDGGEGRKRRAYVMGESSREEEMERERGLEGSEETYHHALKYAFGGVSPPAFFTIPSFGFTHTTSPPSSTAFSQDYATHSSTSFPPPPSSLNMNFLEPHRRETTQAVWGAHSNLLESEVRILFYLIFCCEKDPPSIFFFSNNPFKKKKKKKKK